MRSGQEVRPRHLHRKSAQPAARYAQALMVRIQNSYSQSQRARPIKMRCPSCGQKSILSQVGFQDMDGFVHESPHEVFWGFRLCPDDTCGQLIFIVGRGQSEVVESFPAETIDFDSTDIPELVLAAFREAVECHAHGCYKASAIMVRKTLEEVCAERGAAGKNLHERLEALRAKVALSKPMLDALHDLRLLGNDAAHVELKDFDAVDKKEVEVALDIAKHVLEATYQQQHIMGRLNALKSAAQDGGELPVSA
jgi:hypothetical protein